MRALPILLSASAAVLTAACAGDDACSDIVQVDRYENLEEVSIDVEIQRNCTDLQCDAADGDSVQVVFEGDRAACYTPGEEVVVRFNALETDLVDGGLSGSEDAACQCFPVEAYAPDDPLAGPGEDLRIELSDPAWSEPVVVDLPAASIDHSLSVTLPADGTVSPGDELTVDWTVGTDATVQLDLVDATDAIVVPLMPDSMAGTLTFALPTDLAPGDYRLVGFANAALCDGESCDASVWLSALIDAPIGVVAP